MAVQREGLEMMYALSADTYSGNMWRLLAVLPLEECEHRAEEIDGGPLEFADVGSMTRRAVGEKYIYFVNEVGADARRSEVPGGVRVPYPG